MGTNYYLVKNRPTVLEPIHIGKSSAGWLFLFQAQHEKWNDPPVVWETYNQVKETLKALTVDSTDYVIMNEYDEIVSFDDFFDLVDTKQRDKHNQENKDNFSYHTRNIDGYRFTDDEFS